MDLSHIPKTFWHALSLAILAATLGLVIVAYRSSAVSIEVANTKISLSGVVSETEELAKRLQEESEALERVRDDVERRIQALVSEGRPRALSSGDIEQLERSAARLPESVAREKFERVQMDLRALREAVKKN
jgi:hypothetical protein